MKAVGFVAGIFLFLIWSYVPVFGVDISFSEPLLIEPEPGTLVPAGNIIAATDRISTLYVCVGPTFDLVLMQEEMQRAWLEDRRGWMVCRVDHNGNLVDTASLYICHSDLYGWDNYAYTYKAATWAAPYYYIFTESKGRIYYTRISEDLTLVDNQPVEFMKTPAYWVVDGEYIWIVGINNSGKYFVNRHHLPSPSPEFADIEVPFWFSSAVTKGAGNGLYICDSRDDTLFYSARVTMSGELTIYDPVRNSLDAGYSPFIERVIVPYDTGTAYFCWFERPPSGVYKMQYFSIPPSTPSGDEPPSYDIDCLSRNIPIHSIGAQKMAGLFTFFFHGDWTGKRDNSYLQFDPRTNELANCCLLPDLDAAILAAFSLHDTTASVYYRVGHGAGAAELSTINPPGDYEPHPVLYHSSYDIKPTLLADSAGVLLYNQHSSADSSIISGYRFDVASGAPQRLFSRNIVPVGLKRCAPRLYDLGDRKALFWHEVDDYYYGQLAFFSGDYPSDDNILNRIPLKTASDCHPPAILRIDSLLYIAQFTNWSSEVYNVILYSSCLLCNMNTNSMVPFERWMRTSGRYALVPMHDTAVTAYYLMSCDDYGPASCRHFSCGYHGNLWIDTTIAYFSYIDPCSEGNDKYGDAYLDIFAVPVGDDYLLWQENSLSFFRVNAAERRFDRVIDLQQASGISFGYTYDHPYTIQPVKTDDAYAVFMVDNRYPWKSRLLVFDTTWRFRGDAYMPIVESARDFSQFQYCPQDNRIYFAYSAYLSKPYAASRVFLQSVRLENVTDTDDDFRPLPERFSVEQNSPNPFNSRTCIGFTLPRNLHVKVLVYNILGQQVTALCDTDLPAGVHEVFWDGTSSDGSETTSGIYFYSVQAGNFTATKKMILLK